MIHFLFYNEKYPFFNIFKIQNDYEIICFNFISAICWCRKEQTIPNPKPKLQVSVFKYIFTCN